MLSQTYPSQDVSAVATRPNRRAPDRSAPAETIDEAARVAPDRPRALRDAERTRLSILAAAEAEFSTKGLAGARVDAIADVSGVNKRMIYYYFGNKEDLYVAALERGYLRMRESERALRLDHLPALTAIERLVQFKFDYFERNRSLIQLLNGENLKNAVYLRRSERLRQLHVSLVETIARILARGEAEGSVRRGLDPLNLYISISGLSYFYFSNSATLSVAFGHDLQRPAARRDRRRHAVDVILRYVRPTADD